jgi:hypothetical protein
MFSPTASVRRVQPVRLLALLLAFAGVLFVGVTATDTASAAPETKTKPSISTPVTGTTADGKSVTGTYKITRFATKHGKLVAKGTFTGTVGGAGDKVTKAVTVPVGGPAAASTKSSNANAQPLQATCQILDLVLGPLDLNLLGLVVHLDQVHLNITADQGPGNLLGNLLCAVAGLLDGPSTPDLNAILSHLLNSILGLINLG